MKSLETFEETFSDAVLGYLSTLIFSSFFFRYLLMDAYFRVCMIFVTRSRKSLIDITY